MKRMCRKGLLEQGGRLLVAALLAGLAVTVSPAQEDTPAEEPVPTLHVYTDLVQLPTLVLQGNQQPLRRSINEKQFSISIDQGPWFRVTHARLQGEDPISLSILLDTDAKDMMTGLSGSIAALAPSLLSAKDRVSIYAMDCGLIRSLSNAAPDSHGLLIGVNAVLQAWTARGKKSPGSCKQRTVNLWDALGYVAKQMAPLPGRRVVLAVTDGRDHGSTWKWDEVREYVQFEGLTVFAISNVPAIVTGPGRIFHTNDGYGLQVICQLSGGIVRQTYPSMTQAALQQLLTIVRQRYILEFPRPANSTIGVHGMRVKVAKGEDLFIRPSGISMPLPDATVLKDPTTVRSDPALTPEQGDRHPRKTR